MGKHTPSDGPGSFHEGHYNGRHHQCSSQVVNPIRTPSSSCFILLDFSEIQCRHGSPCNYSCEQWRQNANQQPVAWHLHEGRSSLVLLSRKPANPAPQCPAKSVRYFRSKTPEAPQARRKRPTTVRVSSSSLLLQYGLSCLNVHLLAALLARAVH